MVEILAAFIIFGLGVFAGWRVTDWHYDSMLEPLLRALHELLDEVAQNQYKTPRPKD